MVGIWKDVAFVSRILGGMDLAACIKFVLIDLEAIKQDVDDDDSAAAEGKCPEDEGSVSAKGWG